MNIKSLVRCLVIVGALGMAAAAGAAEKRTEGPSVKSGFRGVSFVVAGDELTDVSPGDRVDVLVTFDAKMKEGVETVTATIIQNVVVLGTEGALVRLMLKPAEAQYVLLAIHAAKQTHVIKRAAGDEEVRPVEIASFRKLFR